MSDIRKIDLLRSFYRSQNYGSSNELRELKEIKNELKVANDLRAREDEEITNATGSPYLEDQPFQRKEVLFGSARETEWKDVPSYEETRNKTLAFRNLKKLNVI